GKEAHVTRGEAAAGTDGAERRHVELDAVPGRGEGRDHVGVGRAELAEHDVVLPAAARHAVVAGAALDPVVAGVAENGVVAAAAGDAVVAAVAGKEVGAAESVDGVV